MTLVVGYDELPRRRSYSMSRTCYAPVPGVSYRRRTRVPLEKLNRKAARRLFTAVYVPAAPSRVDVTHLWNKVMVGPERWGVTFESVMPRIWDNPGDRRLEWARSRMAHQRCRFVIGMSAFARDHLRWSLTESQHAAEIEAKLHQVYPFQAIVPDAKVREPLSDGDPIRLVFVGGAFFRKGGEALLRTIEQHGERLNVNATIISRPGRIDYATRHLGPADTERAVRRLTENERITWHERVPNKQVLEIMANAHIGVLPTLSDTFGFSHLESMANGLPIVGTNIQAGREITDHAGAWRIDLPVDGQGYWSQMNEGNEPYEHAMDLIVQGLTRVLEDLRSAPDGLAERSAAALSHVRQRYATDRTRAMAEIYAELS